MPRTSCLAVLAPLLLLALAACADAAAEAASAPAPLASASAPATATPSSAPAGTPAPAASAAASDCTPTVTLTPASTDGPYYKTGSPERASLVEAGMVGTRLVITGTVRTADCKPVARAWLDFWQTDAAGAYDNAGYHMRGHVFADAEGRYRLETVVPGEYPGRTSHIHVKVQAPGGQTLTA